MNAPSPNIWILLSARLARFATLLPALPHLVGKELQLQQNAVVLCAILSLLQGGALLFGLQFRPSAGFSPDTCFIFGLWLHATLIPLAIGASAIAGEEKMGLRAWQLTFPVSKLSQWMVKLLVASALTALLGVALVRAWSAVGAYFWPWSPELAGDFIIGNTPVPVSACAFIGMLFAFYASSISRDTLRAFMIATGLGVAVAVCVALSEPFYVGVEVVDGIAGNVDPQRLPVVQGLANALHRVLCYVPLPLNVLGYGIGILAAVLMIPMLLCSFRFYQTIDRPIRRVWSSTILALVTEALVVWLVLALFGAVDQWQLNVEANPGILTAK